jgi:CubicO group peptidase (beta-lactamase class C family)
LAQSPAEAFPTATPASQGISATALGELRDVVLGYVDDDKLVGAELLVLDHRRSVMHEVFGMVDREAGVAMQPNTIFNIRSMTKMLTGAAIQMLIDQGDLELSAKAADFLPGFRNPKSENITIEQLLEHRSGLPLSIIIKAGRLDAYPDLLAQANAIGADGPDYPPGSKYWYSDSGTDVLGAIVEVVTGEPLHQFIAERLLGPLQMKDTFYLTKKTPHAQDRVASLYIGNTGSWTRQWQATTPPFYPFPWGSQTLFSTVGDYARFLAMLMDGGRVNGEEILSEAAVKRILTPVSRMTSLGSDIPFPTGFRGLTPYYGQMSVLHVQSDHPESAPVVIGHSGSDGTIAWAWPARDLMILLFTQSRGGSAILRIEGDIERLLIHPGATEDAVPEKYAAFVGTYHDRHTAYTILVQNGQLAIDMAEFFILPLTDPDGQDRSKVPGAGVTIVFARDQGGAVVGLKMHQGNNEFDMVRGPATPEVKVDVPRLRALAGEYHDDAGNKTHRVVILNQRLAVAFDGRPGLQSCYAPDDQGWWTLIADPKTALKFHEAEDGGVDACQLRTSAGEQTLKRRRN